MAKRLGWFQILNLNQEIYIFKNHYFVIKNPNPKTLHIKSSKKQNACIIKHKITQLDTIHINFNYFRVLQ